jgi:hypothetical protein
MKLFIFCVASIFSNLRDVSAVVTAFFSSCETKTDQKGVSLPTIEAKV